MRALLAVAVVLPLAAQTPSDVEFRIRLKDDRTRFHLGETIPLDLLFRTTAPGKYSLDTRLYDRVGRLHFSEEFRVEPTDGVSDPLRDYFPGLPGMGGIGGIVVLGQTPVTIRRDLNEWVRFEKPGQYRVRVLSRRVQELLSDPVEITILPADPEWQAAELKRAIEILETVLPGPDQTTFALRHAAARKIRFLDTPDAVRQCVRWLRGTDPQLDSEFRFGLLGTRHRKAAVEAMEKALRDPGQPVSADFVQTLAKLRAWLESGAPGPALAALIGQLTSLVERKEGPAKAASLRTVTELLTQAGRDVPDKLKTADLLPTLRKILNDPPEGRSDLRDLALRRLYELDPAEGRRRILAEIQRSEPRVGFEVLSMLPDRTLLAVESAIVDHAARTGAWIGRELIARYGSKAILARVKALSESSDRKRPDCESALIAYFLRVDPPYGEERLRQALTSKCRVLVLPQTARYYAGPGWEKIAIEALQDPVVEVKMYAAKALGEHGSAAAKMPLFRAFEYWHTWWKNRPHEINVQNRHFEQELLRALASAKGWKLDQAEFARLQGLCLTPECKDAARR